MADTFNNIIKKQTFYKIQLWIFFRHILLYKSFFKSTYDNIVSFSVSILQNKSLKVTSMLVTSCPGIQQRALRAV